MEKSPEAFRTISEVADWLDTPAHVLRFWESRFPEIAPVKRAGGRRYYRPEDMQLLGGIKHLLHTEGHTIKSVQERLKAGGLAAISAFSPPLSTAPASAEVADEMAAAPATAPGREHRREHGRGYGRDHPEQGATGRDDNGDGLAFRKGNGHAGGRAIPAMPEAARHEDAGGPGDDFAAEDPAAARHGAEAPGHAADPVPAEARLPAAPELPDLPPIGFFFDDSDDAAPAADQSGTFADPFAGEAGFEPFDDALESEPVRPEPDAPRAPVLLSPLPGLPADSEDNDGLGAPPVSTAAGLRGLTRRDLPADWRRRLPEIIARLERIGRAER